MEAADQRRQSDFTNQILLITSCSSHIDRNNALATLRSSTCIHRIAFMQNAASLTPTLLNCPGACSSQADRCDNSRLLGRSAVAQRVNGSAKEFVERASTSMPGSEMPLGCLAATNGFRRSARFQADAQNRVPPGLEANRR